MFPSAIGAVVEGLSKDCQIPLSGQRSPVRAVVPTGFLAIVDIPLCQYDSVKI